VNVTIGTLMQSATHTEPETAQAPVELEKDETSLAWPEGDPRWLLIPHASGSSDDSEAEKPDPAQAIEAFNRMLAERQRESATEVGARR
jgi:hypothetical protein